MGECGEEKLPKRDRRMLGLSKTGQNATVEFAKIRPSNAESVR